MKVKCINNGGGQLPITVNKIYEVKRSIDEFFGIKNDNGELWIYRKWRFEEVKEMEIENVLELEYQDVFDNMVAVRIVYQNEEVLKRDKFVDSEIDVRSMGSPDFCYDTLYLRGRHKENDCYCELVSKEKAEKIKEKVRKINEKYGIRKRWRADSGEKYFCITRDLGEFIVDRWTDNRSITDNRNYASNNYFKTRKEAEIALEKIEQIFKEIK